MSTELLDRAREKLGSDGETARQLGISKQFISNIRKHHSPMPPAMAARLAELLDQRWLDAYLEAAINQEKSPENKRFLAGKLKQLGKAASLVLVSALLALTYPHGASANDLPSSSCGPQGVVSEFEQCILCKALRWN